ncbi:MAG TPA: DUF722 domain-containing protein [Epulopiscium sp.]|nr:DUF722 domain-containing protein [Candidatus Epulonipiscium sp.]
MNKNKYMQATRKMLYNYSGLLIELHLKEQELEFIKTNDGVSGIAYDPTGDCQTNAIRSKVEDIGQMNMEQEERLKNDINALRINIEKINTVLEVLNEFEKAIIQLRYIDSDKKDWGYVADKLGYSEKHCQRMGRHAIMKITSLLFGVKSFVDLPLFEYMGENGVN